MSGNHGLKTKRRIHTKCKWKYSVYEPNLPYATPTEMVARSSPAVLNFGTPAYLYAVRIRSTSSFSTSQGLSNFDTTYWSMKGKVLTSKKWSKFSHLDSSVPNTLKAEISQISRFFKLRADCARLRAHRIYGILSDILRVFWRLWFDRCSSFNLWKTDARRFESIQEILWFSVFRRRSGNIGLKRWLLYIL